jgi:hypothetical protein
MVLFLAHPVAILWLAAALPVVVGGVGRWPGAPIGVGWALAPAVLNPLIWFVGAPLFGWKMAGLGGWLFLTFYLPLNGLAVGVGSIPILGAVLGRKREGVRLFGAGVAVQAATLFAWLAIASQLGMYVGNLSD